MKIPTRSYTLQAFLAMLGFGLFIGILFPFVVTPFVQWIPGRKLPFSLICLAAGLLVGGVGYTIAYLILIRRVRSMGDILRETCMREGDLTFRLPVLSRDVIGDIATSFNENIAHLHEIVKATRQAGDQMASNLANLQEKVIKTRRLVEDTGKTADALEGDFGKLDQSMSGVIGQVGRLSESAQETISATLEQEANIGGIEEQSDKLSGIVEETVSAINELTASNRQVAENAANMSSSVGVIRDMLDKTSAEAQRIQEMVREIDQFYRQMVEESDAGGSKVTDLLGIIREIEKSEQGLDEEFGNLNRDSESIGDIIDVMEDIGEQTGLLALNAAIIAAQAGAEGKAFAVVAGEVRELSDRTSDSAREVGRILGGIRSGIQRAGEAARRSLESVEKGVALSDETGRTLGSLGEMVSQGQERITSVGGFVSEQAQMNKVIIDSMTRFSSLAQEVANAMDEQQSGVERIGKTAQELENITGSVNNALAEQRDASSQVSRSTESVSDLVKGAVTISEDHNRHMDTVKGTVHRIHALMSNSKTVLQEVDHDRGLTEKAKDELLGHIGKFKV